jgi:hypothetical protein
VKRLVDVNQRPIEAGSETGDLSDAWADERDSRLMSEGEVDICYDSIDRCIPGGGGDGVWLGGRGTGEVTVWVSGGESR